MVDQLSHNDEPLKQVTEQEVAVLFVDIVSFTSFAASRSPKEVIRTLRDFHAIMEGRGVPARGERWTSIWATA